MTNQFENMPLEELLDILTDDDTDGLSWTSRRDARSEVIRRFNQLTSQVQETESDDKPKCNICLDTGMMVSGYLTGWFCDCIQGRIAKDAAIERKWGS